MKCPYCNNEIPNNSKSCDICGQEINLKEVLAANDVPEKVVDKAGGIIILLSGLLSFAFGVAWTVGTLVFATFKFYPMLGFSLIGLCLISYGLAHILTGFSMISGSKKFDTFITKMMSISSYGMTIGFYIFWFGFLIMLDYYVLKDLDGMGGWSSFGFSLIFWVFGIYSLYNNIRKKK